MSARIGLTGGMGSGKSTIAAIFKLLGVPVYDSDSRAKNLMEEDLGVIESIKNTFGNKSYNQNGKLERKYLAEKVFKNPILLEKLNQIVHPAVKKDLDKWQSSQGRVPFVIQEAAILHESKAAKYCGKIICVVAPQKLKIDRIRKRDALTNEEILRRMNNQIQDSTRLSLSDYVIINDQKHRIIPQVLNLHAKLSLKYKI